jgi:hypothetical protein
MLFGVIPALLLSLFCLFVIMVTAGRLGWTLYAWIPVKYVFMLSVMGLGSCASLIISSFRAKPLSEMTKAILVLLLRAGMVNALIILGLVATTFFLHRFTVAYLSMPLFLAIPLSMAAIKQINLLKTSESRRPS